MLNIGNLDLLLDAANISATVADMLHRWLSSRGNDAEKALVDQAFTALRAGDKVEFKNLLHRRFGGFGNEDDATMLFDGAMVIARMAPAEQVVMANFFSNAGGDGLTAGERDAFVDRFTREKDFNRRYGLLVTLMQLPNNQARRNFLIGMNALKIGPITQAVNEINTHAGTALPVVQAHAAATRTRIANGLSNENAWQRFVRIFGIVG